ncbi:MAG TPA: hypothetical protein VIS49_14740 [Cyclobacteriaceae bacterium]
MQTCRSGKRCFINFELAEEALIGAHVAYNYGKGSGPVGVYQCGECGHYHLTSQGIVNKRLEQLIKNGDIQKQREAHQWEGKWKKR